MYRQDVTDSERVKEREQREITEREKEIKKRGSRAERDKRERVRERERIKLGVSKMNKIRCLEDEIKNKFESAGAAQNWTCFL